MSYIHRTFPIQLPIRPLQPLYLLTALTLLLVLGYNDPLWQLIWQQPYASDTQRLIFCAAFLSFMVAVIQLCLSLLAWPRLIKPLAAMLLISAASVNHFMDSYGVVIDKTMIQNLFETDAAEAADMVNTQLLLDLLLKGFLPTALIMMVPIRHQPIRSVLAAQLLSVLLCLMTIGGNAALLYKDYSSLFRNHREIRNLAVPSNYLYYSARYLAGAYTPTNHTFQPLGLDAVRQQPAGNGQKKPDLLVVVLGETARSQNFSLNGYPRETNPELIQRAVTSFSNVESCGTSTAVSVPCMFSMQTRNQYDDEQTAYQSNVLDILQQAGITVLWRDNNSGCKGVCTRVSHENTSQFSGEHNCDNQECFDEQMLNGLQDWLAAQAGSAVIVLHQKGSHGPAYYKRVPQAYVRFTPVCNSNQLQSCSQATITNAYDNTIRYTDHLLSRVIDFLQQQDDAYNTAMLYISDHGESLGENNLYLHGMPWLLAPEEQKRVPLITWLSGDFQRSHQLPNRCLQDKRDTPLSHDYLSHSLLGLMRVKTQVYAPELDLFASCQTTGSNLAQGHSAGTGTGTGTGTDS